MRTRARTHTHTHTHTTLEEVTYTTVLSCSVIYCVHVLFSESSKCKQEVKVHASAGHLVVEAFLEVLLHVRHRYTVVGSLWARHGGNNRRQVQLKHLHMVWGQYTIG